MLERDMNAAWAGVLAKRAISTKLQVSEQHVEIEDLGETIGSLKRDAKENREMHARERDALEVSLPLSPLSSPIHRTLGGAYRDGGRDECCEGERTCREGAVGGMLMFPSS